MELVVVVLVVVVCLLVFLQFVKKPKSEPNAHMAYMEIEKEKAELTIQELRIELRNEHDVRIKAEESLKAQSQTLTDREAYINELQNRFKLEFENIANKILTEKTASFTEKNKENLDLILKPLKENIKAFEEKVDKVYKEESVERNKLEGVLREMMVQSRQIQTDANNLSKALKGDNKKQGNWGEVVLERVLEGSGLMKDREYRLQASLASDTGSRRSPDVIIDLPEGKNLIVDAKVSLVNYERMVNAETEEERIIHLKLHIQSIKAHIEGLSKKNYQHLYAINSPDFVLLFVPIESSFSITLQADHELFNYAWNKGVVIVSPTTLLATLRTIASIWKVDRQNKNVTAIADEAGALYDKFVGFLEDMDKIGKNLGQAQKSHEEAFKKLSSGSGNLIGKVEKIKKMGAKNKASKQIDTKFLEND